MADEKKRGRTGHIVEWLRRSGAAIVAVAAVALATWEGLENRRHNRLSVVPKLDAVRDFDMLEQTFAFGFSSPPGSARPS